MSATEIKAWRERNRLTQGELGRLLGLKSGAVSVSSWERGKAAPQPYLRLALSLLEIRLGAERERLLRQIDHDLDPS